MMTPFPFQRADVNAALRAQANGFIVAETGAGKTLIGTQIGVESQLPTKLVIAPRGTLRTVWEKTIISQDPDARVRRIDGTEGGKDAYADLEMGEPGWYLATPQIFTRWGFATVRPDFALVDEAHQLSNRDSKGGKALRKLKAGHRMVASGTMVRNKFENFWNLLRWVYPDRNGLGSTEVDIAQQSFNQWVTEFCKTEYDHFAPGNRRVIDELEPGRLANLIPLYLQHFKRQRCCAFHPEGFLAHLPAPIEIDHEVELTPGQRRAIDRMERDYITWLDDHPMVTKFPMVARVRIRQMTLGMPSIIPAASEDDKDFVYFDPDCDSPKMEAVLEDIYKGEPLILSTTSQKFAEAKVQWLNNRGIKAFEWSGQKTEKERDQALLAFEQGHYQMIVGQSAAISTGLDGFQHVANELVSLDEDDDLSNAVQLEGRLDRTGQKYQVVHHRMIAKGSLDEGIIGSHLQRRLSLAASLKREVRAA